MSKPLVLIAYLGNINYDSRTLNFYRSLTEKGYPVKVICFDWLSDNFIPGQDEFKIIKLKKNRLSILFYLHFAFRLIYFLLTNKATIYLAEDVYTLPFVTIAAKLNNGKVFYDSRELYGYLAGLANRNIVQYLIKKIETYFIKKTYTVITTGEMDSQFIENEYGVKNTLVIRNLPLYSKPEMPVNFYNKLNISPDKIILLYQGVIIHGRGLKIVFEILADLSSVVLVIIGGGEQKVYYENLAKRMKVNDQVYFMGKIKQDELTNYTAGGYIGLALIENLSLSYYYALPNKLFEYVMAEIPVIVSNFPQMEAVVNKYKAGFSVDPEDRENLINTLKKLINDKQLYQEIKLNCRTASNDLNWNKEIKKFFINLNNK
jgi:glycosyltransferase involved in cell wall biosynthesis